MLRDLPTLRWSTLFKVILVLLTLTVAVLALLQMPWVRIVSSDLFLYFRPAARTWLSGGNPYEVPGFVNPPWSLPLLVPFSLGPPRLGYVLLFCFSCLVLAAAVRTFGGGTWTLLGVLISLPTISLLTLGQLDIWVLAGVLVGRWAVGRDDWAALGVALALVLVKPQTGSLVALAWMLTLPWALKWKALVTLGAIWMVTCLVVGVWWPFAADLSWRSVNLAKSVSTRDLVRSLRLSQMLYPTIAAALVGLWVWETLRRGPTDYILALSLLVSVLSTPYVLRHSLSVPLATAFVLLARRLRWWAFLSYALTWMPVLTLLVGRRELWWEVAAWWVWLAGLIAAAHGRYEE